MEIYGANKKACTKKDESIISILECKLIQEGSTLFEAFFGKGMVIAKELADQGPDTNKMPGKLFNKIQNVSTGVN